MPTQSMPEFSSIWSKPSPPPGSRIKPEAVQNYERNRGTIQSLVFEQVAPTSSLAFTPRPSPRCPTSASKVNYKLGVNGNVGSVMNSSATPRPSSAPAARIKPEAVGIATISRGTRMRPIIHEQSRDGPTQRQPRVKPAGEGIARISKGARMNTLIHEKSEDGPTPRQPRVKPEGEGIATVSKGKRMRTLLHEFAKHGPSPRQPRVKPEAEDTAEVAKGGRMSSMLHKYGSMPLSARAVPRVKSEAMDNATLDQGKRMETILHSYGRNQPSPRAAPRVKTEGEDNAELDKGKRMATVLHSFALPLSSRPPPRVKPEASQSAEIGQGFRMARLMHESHKIPGSPRPAARAVGDQAKQNLWRGVVGSVGKCLKQNGQKNFIFVPGHQARRYSSASVM
ncbi:hypothetical protein V1264_010649 [Littorina saxatilis]|uniref:Uncharacterized protein n=1 Tax=Littorina saxatilis TaxID=31220 RepID=A0AAN9APW7_9CAEN